MDALNVLCAQLTLDLFAIAKFLYDHSRNSDSVTPGGGAKYRWGIKISPFPTNKSLYHANDTR